MKRGAVWRHGVTLTENVSTTEHSYPKSGYQGIPLYPRSFVKTLKNVVCVFGERRAQLTHLTIVAEGTSARTGRLDALGLDLAPGPDAYFNLLARLSSEFSRCLGRRE